MGYIQLFRCERRRWVCGLAAIAVACCLVTIIVFSPGYMSPDSLNQLKQALGKAPLTDWHPPVLALVWQGLIAVTGTPSAMVVAQCVICWATLWVIAWCVWALTDSRPGSLAVLGVGLAPQVLTFVGVVWKDVHMAFALLAACAVALVGKRLPAGRSALRWALLGLGVLFIAYAVLVRKNAILAAIPVFVMLVLALWPKPGRRLWLMSSAALVVAVVVPSTAIAAFARPLQTSQGSQIMMDDLVHVLSVDEVRAAAAAAATTPDFQVRLLFAAKQCERNQTLSDTYISCYPRDATADVTGLAPHADELTSMWTSEIPGHLPAYFQYRLQVFSQLLFRGTYQYQPGISANTLGLKVTHARLEATLQNYVLGAANDLPALFAGWLWLAVALALSIRPGKGTFSMPVRALGISSVAYVLGYLPTLPTADFRYIYWPAIACTLGLLLAWLGRGSTPPPLDTGATESGRIAVRQSVGPKNEQLAG
ncbi:hypothetical protein [Streptomyces sp. R41]|uniref:Glycosyltransferase RgtA/B/C/D-like domain-containing protein n=1 Tax=Streptomyces sp. R41 TaxID=3238632 RepID=A0AB39RXQ7_9ACTN